MNTMLTEHGVTNVRWTDEELAAFEQAWSEVMEEQSAQDEDFRRSAESYPAFRKEYKTWGDAQALKPTYLGSVSAALIVRSAGARPRPPGLGRLRRTGSARLGVA